MPRGGQILQPPAQLPIFSFSSLAFQGVQQELCLQTSFFPILFLQNPPFSFSPMLPSTHRAPCSFSAHPSHLLNLLFSHGAASWDQSNWPWLCNSLPHALTWSHAILGPETECWWKETLFFKVRRGRGCESWNMNLFPCHTGILQAEFHFTKQQ